MPVSPSDVDRVVEAVTRDVSVTLGWSVERARDFVMLHGCDEEFAALGDDALTLAARVIRSTQEAIQLDERIDTTWPICLQHQTHPLDIDEDLSWHCPEEDWDDPKGVMRRVPLGWLDAVWPRTG